MSMHDLRKPSHPPVPTILAAARHCFDLACLALILMLSAPVDGIAQSAPVSMSSPATSGGELTEPALRRIHRTVSQASRSGRDPDRPARTPDSSWRPVPGPSPSSRRGRASGGGRRSACAASRVPAWSVALPINVIVRGPALVANATLQAGAVPGPADFRLEEIELTREPLPVLSDPSQFAGRVMSRPIAAGQPLRADHLRQPQTVAAGDPDPHPPVGDGFAIVSDGVASVPGGEGQPMRARTESGRIVSGTLRDRTVDVML
jgi:flagella basal body P-ring formation protein FlgA